MAIKNSLAVLTFAALLLFSGCSAGNNMLSSVLGSPVSVSPIEPTGEESSQFFFTSASAANPSAGAVVNMVSNNSSGRTLYFDKAIITCSAACQETISQINTSGLGCSAGVSHNLNSASSTPSAATTAFSCATIPVAISSINISVQAAGTYTVDLKGYISGPGTGIDIGNVNAVSGTVATAIFWHEK